MAKVKIHRLIDGNYMRFHQGVPLNGQGELAEKLFKHCGYKVVIVDIEAEMPGMLAAEEMFDLFNNPARHDEAMEVAVVADLCTGDIVEVDGSKFVCCSFGWYEFA
jgi:hypothetical protein